MIILPTCNGRHRPRRMETILKNLTDMKNASRRHMDGYDGNFITLVRTHNKVLKCHRRQQITREMCKNGQEFRKNPWQYVHKKLQPSNNPDPSFDHSSATSYFTETYSDSTVTYNKLPDWTHEFIPDCDPSLFNTEKITPGLVKSTLKHCSMQSAPGMDGITYYHLYHLPSIHHFMATLFNKLLETGTAPPSWGVARLRLIHKSGDTSDPSNFRPIALTCVVGKLFHKILSRHLEIYLRANNVIDTSIQKGFVSGLPGVFEHIYSLSAIMEDALTNRKPLMMTFLDLKNAFGSVSHQLIFDMLEAVKVPPSFKDYVQSFYSQFFVIVKGNSWETDQIPFKRGVFQGDTLSPIIFLLVFNPVLKLAESLNSSHGYQFQLKIKDTEMLPPVGTYVYIKWTEDNGELPGWYKAYVDEYYTDGSCKIVYSEDNGQVVYETVDLNRTQWLPCSKRARKFVPLETDPVTSKAKWRPSLKVVNSSEHSMMGYADDVTLVSDNFDIHVSVLQTVDRRACDLDLSFKPVKCISYLFDGSKCLQKGIVLSKGVTRSITEGGTKFLGKLIGVSLSATKRSANKRMVGRITELLSATDTLRIRGEYRLWIYRNYILSLLRFHLSVDAVTPTAISKMESMATRYLKRWLHLPRSATRVVLYYPGICCPSVSNVTREAKISLLSCISASSDPKLQELGVHLHLGQEFLQFQDCDYSILSTARKQLSSLPTARSLYVTAKTQLLSEVKSTSEDHLQTLSVQCKFADSAELETSCRTWNRLLSSMHPGQLSFLLRAASDTLPTAMNLRRWNIQCHAKCVLCDSSRPTTAHVLGGCPVALSQERYTYRHNLVIQSLVDSFIRVYIDLPYIRVYADLPNLRASESPPSTLPPNVIVTPFRPDIVIHNTVTSSILLFELTCPLDSAHHLEQARSRKQNKAEYHQILSELDRLNVTNFYETLEISVLGHFQQFSVTNTYNVLHFIDKDINITRSLVRRMLDDASKVCMTASQRIFMARDCQEWL